LAAELELLAGVDEAGSELGAIDEADTEDGVCDDAAIELGATEDAGVDDIAGLELDLPPPLLPPQAVNPKVIKIRGIKR